ncbi:MAG TPA: hypothetical protein IAA63_01480 [Candidatus Pullilachnospira stercoravium]|uniref:Uncharacterized protein n=1 Tax=Candidatus Pullilachnospira stercoravium TaxID=2840913 RepID=A0A9D1NSN1_9FIRM|nr:hypothetical protein [Candidatus Pullilachnospira stercoravium]
MTERTEDMKVQKGEFGYIRWQKKRRILVTLGLFLLPLAAFIAGVLVTGTRNNLITVIAVVGCLPACRSMVGVIMMWMQQPMEETLYREIRQHQKDLTMAYELVVTTYEKNAFLDAVAICGNKVAAYSSRMKESPEFIEQHIRKILKQNGFKTEVKVFKEKRTYLDRLDHLNAHKEELERDIKFTPDERYPELSRDELIRHLILAISL